MTPVIGSSQAQPEIATSDGYGIRQVGEASVRVQIKSGDPIPPGTELESGKGGRSKPKADEKD